MCALCQLVGCALSAVRDVEGMIRRLVGMLGGGDMNDAGSAALWGRLVTVFLAR